LDAEGEITKEEAIEIMDQRARQEAMKSLYGGPPAAAPAPTEGEAQVAVTPEARASRSRRLWLTVGCVILGLLALLGLLVSVLWRHRPGAPF